MLPWHSEIWARLNERLAHGRLPHALLLAGLYYRTLSWSMLYAALVDTAVVTAGIMIIVGVASMVAFAITFDQIPAKVAQAMLSITSDKTLLLLIINGALLVLGFFLEPISIMILTLPVLVLIGDAVGVFGAYLVGTLKLGFTPHSYLSNTADFLETQDVVSGLVKAAVFGYLIALMGCYHGYYSKGGAQGVGAAATNAVVSASILLLSADYLLTEIFFVQ